MSDFNFIEGRGKREIFLGKENHQRQKHLYPLWSILKKKFIYLEMSEKEKSNIFFCRSKKKILKGELNKMWGEHKGIFSVFKNYFLPIKFFSPSFFFFFLLKRNFETAILFEKVETREILNVWLVSGKERVANRFAEGGWWCLKCFFFYILYS